jgi:hypothetical protein
MPNYFTDNQDIQFLFDHFDLREIAAIQEREIRGDCSFMNMFGLQGRRLL